MKESCFSVAIAARLWVSTFLVLACVLGCGSTEETDCPGQTLCDGACHDVLSDASHCGGCGIACGDGQLCVNGDCSASCPPGQKVCDGRCVDVLSSQEHCGTCGKGCDLDQVCSSGACSSSCGGLTPYECAGACVDIENDPLHCGACGNACAAGKVCSNGECAAKCGPANPTLCSGLCVDTQSNPLACGDCDTECGADQVCDHGKCTSECSGSAPNRCGRKCVDLRISHESCGACGHACEPGDVCSGGQCLSECADDTPKRCGLSCVDVRSDRLNCGDCGKACDDGQVCADGECASECSGSRPLFCDGTCVNPASDPRFCGACDVKCDAGQVCSGGRCVAECDGLTATKCGGLCVDTLSDPSFCGSCDRHCSPGAVCSGGKCAAKCLSDELTQCGDACVDLATHPSHCGECGNACSAGQVCSDGRCSEKCGGDTPLACGGACVALSDAEKCGLKCFGKTPDRCEDGCFDLKSDSKHCGDCDVACGAGTQCVEGGCKALCSESKPALCGGVCVDTLTDANNCGGCGTKCEAFEICTTAQCKAHIVDVSTGGSVTCLTLVDGQVACFGYSGLARLGDPNVRTYVFSRTRVKNLGGKSKELHVGGSVACVILESGAFKCWGDNPYGELGVDPGQMMASALPLSIEGLPTSLRTFAIGVSHVCAVAADGGVWCWGRGDYGQLGDAAVTPVQWTPTEVAGVAHDVVAIAAAQNHTCVRHDWPDAAVTCWGRNGSGQLGNVPPQDPFAPVGPTLVQLLPKPAENVDLKRSLAIGTDHSCAIGGEGDVYCWGSNYIKQLGLPDANIYPTATKVPGLPLAATALFADGFQNCAILSDESLWCWGDFAGAGSADPQPVARVWEGHVVGGDLGDQIGFALLEGGAAVSFGEAPGDLQGRVIDEAYRPGLCCGDW